MAELAYFPDPKATRDAFRSRGYGCNCRKGFPAALLASLTHYWSLDEGAGSGRIDSIAGLSMTEQIGPVANIIGKDGNAANLRAVSGRYLQSANENLSVPFSLAVWANPHTLVGFQDICIKDDSTNGGPRIYANGINVNFGNASNGALASIAFGSTDAWHLLILVIASNGNYSASVDGSIPTAGAPSLTTGLTNLSYAVGNVGISSSFDGYVDAFMVFNRDLTPDEISSLWNGGAGRFP